MSAEPVRRRKNRKTNTSLGIPHAFSFPLLPTHECRAVNLHMMILKILFHMDVKSGNRTSAPSIFLLHLLWAATRPAASVLQSLIQPVQLVAKVAESNFFCSQLLPGVYF